MRDQVIAYLTSLKLRGIVLSLELPFDANGNPLFVKNPKRIYVGQEQTVVEPFIQVFNGNDINLSTTIITVYFSTDAKQLPQEYSSTVTALKNTRAIDADTKYYKRQCDVSTEFMNDLLVTSVELRFSSITTS